MRIQAAESEAEVVKATMIRLLSAHAVEQGYSYAPVSVVLKVEEAGQIVAGLTGYTNWDWMYIETLAVDPACRGRGLGRRLVREAEEIAKARHCRGAWVDTFSFQSPAFYERLGYQQFGVLPDHPAGQQHLFLRKLF